MTKEPYLLPCPFCGGSAQLQFAKKYDGYTPKSYFVTCEVCGVRGPKFYVERIRHDEEGAKIQAIFWWNRRPSFDAARDGCDPVRDGVPAEHSNY